MRILITGALASVAAVGAFGAAPAGACDIDNCVPGDPVGQVAECLQYGGPPNGPVDPLLHVVGCMAS